jgi:PIN domain nuclease of toxin-antitoxin system
MRALLDTHTFLWWTASRGSRISAIARELIQDGETEIVLSVVSIWEIAIKVGSGRIELPGPIGEFIPDRMGLHAFGALAVEASHALRVAHLPPIHRDPFDRLLVAQAQVEGIPIVTADPAIAQYDVETIW